jgi:hypothetical protein
MFSPTTAAASLTPPQPPALTMKPLDQVEPRIPITSLPMTIDEPGSYYLTGNLSSPSNGISIEADDVTIDLMGFTMTGSGGASGIQMADTVDPRNNVVVRNGSIRSFNAGVYMVYAEDCRFEDLLISDSTSRGFDIRFADKRHIVGISIRDCHIIGSGQHGIFANGTSALATFSENSIVGCVVRGNGDDGILLYTNGGTMKDNVIEACTVTSNGGFGIQVTANQDTANISGTSIRDCMVSNHPDGGGIEIFAANSAVVTGSQIVNCHVRGSNFHGINLASTNDTLVEGNHVADTTGGSPLGIRSVGALGNLIIRNVSMNNGSNYLMNAADTVGPIVNITGTLANTGDAAHPWANFSY